jgi:hypothetical protein
MSVVVLFEPLPLPFPLLDAELLEEALPPCPPFATLLLVLDELPELLSEEVLLALPPVAI